MEAITITFGIQKGGCAKTTSAMMLGQMLHAQGKKVLMVDMDSQGNLTETITQVSSNECIMRSVLEAMQTNELDKYIIKGKGIEEGFDLLPANNYLATFPRWLYTYMTYRDEMVKYHGSSNKVLDRLLDQARESYDYIIIDTPPALGEHTINALFASDYCVVMYESSRWCYSAIHNFLDSVVTVSDNPESRGVQPIGILRRISDVKRGDTQGYIELVEEDYPDLVFDTILKTRATVGRISEYGVFENPEMVKALIEYMPFYGELMERVGERTKQTTKEEI